VPFIVNFRAVLKSYIGGNDEQRTSASCAFMCDQQASIGTY